MARAKLIIMMNDNALLIYHSKIPLQMNVFYFYLLHQ